MHGSYFSLLYTAQYITSNDHQCMVCSVFNKLFHSCGSLAVSIGQKEKALLHFFSRARSLGPSVPMAPTILGTFIQRSSLVTAGIQLVVALTTLLMVVRFGLDALRHRTGSNGVKVTLQILDGSLLSRDHATPIRNQQLLPGVGGAAGHPPLQRQDRPPCRHRHEADPPG